jgi:hypothetical protein
VFLFLNPFNIDLIIIEWYNIGMTIRETRPFGIPKELHEKPLHEALLAASGIANNQDSSRFMLSHVVITANKLGECWYGYAVHPEIPVSSEEDTLGAFIEEDDVNAQELLMRAEDWIRSSSTVEWVPGRIIQSPNEDPRVAMGHILVRAAES